jgi:hypothetical protein
VVDVFTEADSTDSCHYLLPVQEMQVAAQLVFRSEDDHPDRGKPTVQCTRNLGVTHSLVVPQHERNLVALGQAIQLFPNLELVFFAENLRER